MPLKKSKASKVKKPVVVTRGVVGKAKPKAKAKAKRRG